MPRLYSLLLASSFSAACALACPSGALAQVLPSVDPPYVPTPDHLVEAMLDMGRVSSGDVVYDLGSGDGRMVIAAAERGARATGIEYEEWLVTRSWGAAESAGVLDRVDFRSEDLFATDVSDATVVLIYLSAEFNLRLRSRLLRQLRPGARVVSHAFHMGDWVADGSRTIGTGAARATLYSWIVPANLDGFWVLDIEGAAALSLEFEQRFQEVAGEVRRGGRVLPIGPGRIAGDSIRFRIDQRRGGRKERYEFMGRLSGDTLRGRVSGPPGWGTRAWYAVRTGTLRVRPATID